MKIQSSEVIFSSYSDMNVGIVCSNLAYIMLSWTVHGVHTNNVCIRQSQKVSNLILPDV